jgi:hypothetical protein
VTAADASQKEWFDDDSFWIDQYASMFSDQRFAEAAASTEKLVTPNRQDSAMSPSMGTSPATGMASTRSA